MNTIPLVKRISYNFYVTNGYDEEGARIAPANELITLDLPELVKPITAITIYSYSFLSANFL